MQIWLTYCIHIPSFSLTLPYKFSRMKNSWSFWWKCPLVPHTGLDIKSSPHVGSPHAAVLPGSGDAGAAQPSSQVPVHSGFLSTAPFVGSLETKYVSARNGEWDSWLFPSCTHTLSLSKFVGNQISLGFQKYLSWSFGRIPSWWESAFSKKAGNKSPKDTGTPSHCITPVAKSRPLPSVASLFS